MTMTYPTTAEFNLQLKLVGGEGKDHPILLVVKVYKFLEINEIEIKKSIWFQQTNQAQPKPKTLSGKEIPSSNQATPTAHSTQLTPSLY